MVETCCDFNKENKLNVIHSLCCVRRNKGIRIVNTMKHNLTRTLLKNEYLTLLAVGFEDFMVNKCAKIISGGQPCQY
jgi:hypothetical protein